MRILFVHQNFPAQFVHLAPVLAARGHEVVALGMRRAPVALPGVRVVNHIAPAAQRRAEDESGGGREWRTKVQRGKATVAAIRKLRSEGFVPDVVFGHSGWGETLFVKDESPDAKLAVYAEFYYAAQGLDAGFDPEFRRCDPEAAQRTRLKNTHLLHSLVAADAAVSPTHFQRDAHPAVLREKIEVIHDGIDTARFRPDHQATVRLERAGVLMRPGDEVVTFVARSLEPYRGFHVFMRALPRILRERPNARVVIVGAEGVSYGAAAPGGRSWKRTFIDEVRDRVDLRRVHFVGRVPHETLTQLMQVSAAHVYLTYPFVLSWSLLEAMSIGCLVVASRTAPVEEVITDGQNGVLVDFFAPDALASAVVDAIAHPERHQRLRAAARETVSRRYDLRRVCLPRQIEFVTRLAG